MFFDFICILIKYLKKNVLTANRIDYAISSQHLKAHNNHVTYVKTS